MTNSKEYSRAYYATHRDMARKSKAKWSKNNPEYNRIWCRNNHDKVLASKRRSRKTIPYRFNKYKSNAEIRGLSFPLSISEFKDIVNLDCHYCGSSVQNMGIDRKDNTMGYIKTNVVPCCWTCNRMKFTTNYKEFIHQCDLISKTKRPEQKNL